MAASVENGPFLDAFLLFKRKKKVTSSVEFQVAGVFHMHLFSFDLSHGAESYHLFYSCDRVYALIEVFLHAPVFTHIFSSLIAIHRLPLITTISKFPRFPVHWEGENVVGQIRYRI